jgi:hypothetical protein
MRISLFAALAAAIASTGASVSGTEFTPEVQRPAKEPVWEAHLSTFSDAEYNAKVEKLISGYERTNGHMIAPRVKKKVGLKIYSDSGPGLETPTGLVKGVIAALQRRGYKNKDIFLVGLNQLRLRMAGYLPSLVTSETPFKGNPVFVLESNRYYDPVWFYDSPLPERFDPIFAAHQTEGVPNTSTKEEDRKSFLATPLFLDTDFWINLPVYTDHQTLGVNGALVNATLWNASNTARFFRSPATAPAAVAEMSAIPELRQTWLFTIASLEHFQFIGGPFFNSLYTRSEPLLWLGTDPVMLDALMRTRINQWRRKEGFEAISDEIRTLEFAETLGVGSTLIKSVKMIDVD